MVCNCTCCRGEDWIALGDGWFECRGCGCKARVVPATPEVPTNG